jgi:phosphopantothenoylcysteine decarboxylase
MKGLDVTMEDETLLVIATGSSGAIALPTYLVRLRQAVPHKLQVLMTASAERFVRAEVVSWVADEVITVNTDGINPVELALKAKGIVVLPASANTLTCAALGLALTPATTVLLAAAQPCLFFPQMNPVMWQKKIVQEHVADLRDSGHVVVDPEPNEVYEIWRRATHPGYAMPSADAAAQRVREWLSGEEDGDVTAPGVHDAEPIDATFSDRRSAKGA